MASPWTDEEQRLLEEGLARCAAVCDLKKKWQAVARLVKTRDARACAERFRECREMALRGQTQEEEENEEEDEEDEAEDDYEEEEEEVTAATKTTEHEEEDEQSRHGSNRVWKSGQGRGQQRGRGYGGQNDEGNYRARGGGWKGGGRASGAGWWSSSGWNDWQNGSWEKDAGGATGSRWQEWQQSSWQSEEGGEAACTSWQGSEDAQGDQAVSEENPEEAAPLTDAERRKLEMNREKEANLERMRRREDQKEKEKATRIAKEKAEAERVEKEKNDKLEAAQQQRREVAEAAERKRREAAEEAQRKAAEREAAEASTPFFGPRPEQGKGRGKSAKSAGLAASPAAAPPARGWASKAASKRGEERRKFKDDEAQRQAAEVLAAINASKNGCAAVAACDEPADEQAEDVEEAPSPVAVDWTAVAAVQAAPKTRQPRAPIGPATGMTPVATDAERDRGPPVGDSPRLSADPSPAAAAVPSAAARARDCDGRGRGAGRGTDPKKRLKKRWWSSMDGDCPISLAPLADLPAPPFGLETQGAAQPHYFDARFLASFLLSTCDFIDPVNRRPLTRDECTALDDHLRWHHAGEDATKTSVTDAFALFQIRRSGGEGDAADERVQREATVVLQHLFRFGSHRRTDNRGRAVNYSDAGLTVVDDDDILTPLATGEGSGPSRSAASASAVAAVPEDSADSFPMLPGGKAASAKPRAVSKAYPGAGRGGRGGRGYDGADFPVLGPPGTVGSSVSAKAPSGRGRGRGGPTKQSLYRGPKGWGTS
eukprot:TRINITY_DN43103_c0_g1_i1.p1 TRINITY_DN43103_c0_g1~~TRINITY_DN43103_c0_g1_i1.p1  ORF type:complete len:792 (-),score=195.09 TRINITY_DN43103_c0_g1_i1:182-2491(-)